MAVDCEPWSAGDFYFLIFVFQDLTDWLVHISCSDNTGARINKFILLWTAIIFQALLINGMHK